MDTSREHNCDTISKPKINIMKHFSFYIGIDVSKLWLDIAVLDPNRGIIHQVRIDNEVSSIRAFLKSIRKDFAIQTCSTLFCMENTGKYGHTFLKASLLEKAMVWVELPLQIKKSQGLVRGKSDRWDAVRIAEYAYRFSDKATIWQPVDKTLQELKELQSKRNRLVKVHSQLIQESKKEPFFKKTLTAIKKDIAAIEEKMQSLISTDSNISHNHELLQSVPGIGKQTATALIIATNGFNRLTQPKKLSCYAGIAPFEYTSGSSVKGRTKVSKMGDMRLKTLLNLGAWNAIRSIPQLKNFFLRKVAEGKHKISVINAVRNKLIAIALAVVKRNKPFVKNFSDVCLVKP